MKDSLHIFSKKYLDVDVKLPIQRMTWQEAMDRFGSDKPDMRFGMELHDVSEVVRDCDFVVFTECTGKWRKCSWYQCQKARVAMPRKED